MTPEFPLPTTREINFYGEGYARGINLGLKLVTLRVVGDNNKYADIVAGQHCEAICQEGRVPITVLHSAGLPLKEIPIPVLGLDGYFSPEFAAQELQKFYPQTVTPETHIQLIMFAGDNLLNQWQLGETELTELTNTPPLTLMQDPDYRHLFLPALNWMYCFRHPNTHATNWQEFLNTQNLITDEEYRKAREQSRHIGWSAVEMMHLAEGMMEENMDDLCRCTQIDWLHYVVFVLSS